MKCPKCGCEMQRTGLSKAEGPNVFSEIECPCCHYRIQQTPKRPSQ